MNFSWGQTGTEVRCESPLFSQGKTPEFTKMGEIHKLFVLALSLVWFAGATPDLGGSEASFLELCFGRFCMEMSTPRQLLRSLGPLLETFVRTPPNFREVPPGAFPVGRVVGRLSYFGSVHSRTGGFHKESRSSERNNLHFKFA